MGFLKPAEPDFDVEEMMRAPVEQRLRTMSASWVLRGFGAPGVVYLFYVLKLGLYVGGFLAFAATTRGIGGLGDLGDWWSEPIVFQKAVVWTLLFEVTGFGCSSGPLAGRNVPPVTSFLYFLRTGTTRLAPFPQVPFTAGHRRTPVDVALYAAMLVFVLRALLAPEMSRPVVVPILVVFVLLGLRDKTVFLAARAEHYLLAAFVFLFPGDLWAGEKAVQAGLWIGAATSKLNHHFPDVIAVMTSNNPLLRWPRLRKAFYRNYPTDMRGSRLAATVAHAATVVEYSLAVLLVTGTGGPATTIGLVLVVLFHGGILTSFPLGVPLEWNLFFVYSAFVLFGAHADVRLWSIDSPLLVAVLVVCLVVLPLAGNLRPDKVSFLVSMRYYAGNWATSRWLLRPSAHDKIEQRVPMPVTSPRQQMVRMTGPEGWPLMLARGHAFRSMHLHGRALNQLLGPATDDVDDPDVRARGSDAYDVVDGELIAGMVLGWNFGCGHLHDERLVEILQQECGFEPGELRVIMLESQPIQRATHHWRIVDAATGPVAQGEIHVRDLRDRQPWDGTPGTPETDAPVAPPVAAS